MEEFEELQPGEMLRKGDEYSTMPSIWRAVPEFMIGDIIPENDQTQWRRQIVIPNEPHKKKWFPK